MRYFITKEEPSLEAIDFEIPVRIRNGSWEALIPEIIDKLFTKEGAVGAGLVTYATVTATKAANDGFLETGAAKDLGKIFVSAIRSAQWVIKIASHVGRFAKKDIEAIPKNNTDKEIIIQIWGSENHYIDAPKKYYDLYTECPESLLKKIYPRRIRLTKLRLPLPSSGMLNDCRLLAHWRVMRTYQLNGLKS